MIQFVIPDLKLPSTNEILGWHRWKRAEEVKRIRSLVTTFGMASGLGGIIPAKLCDLKITACGPYQRDKRHSYDTNNLYAKDLIDALIAKPLYSRNEERRIGIERDDYRRWGLIVDDSPAVIGAPVIELKDADKFDVIVEVTPK